MDYRKILEMISHVMTGLFKELADLMTTPFEYLIDLTDFTKFYNYLIKEEDPEDQED